MMRNVGTKQKGSRLLRPVKNSAGMTMAEVLVAFAVLMLVLALVNTAVQTSLNLSNMAEDVRQKTESVLTGYYSANRAASETTCSFGDFYLKTYPGVYNDEATGYSIYRFHDGQDHTPPPPPPPAGWYPAWLPRIDNGASDHWATDADLKKASDKVYVSWNIWWDAVVDYGSAEAWLSLIDDNSEYMPQEYYSYVLDNSGTIKPPGWS